MLLAEKRRNKHFRTAKSVEDLGQKPRFLRSAVVISCESGNSISGSVPQRCCGIVSNSFTYSHNNVYATSRNFGNTEKGPIEAPSITGQILVSFFRGAYVTSSRRA